MPIKKGESSKGYTRAKTLAAISGSAGIKSTIADRLGCEWNTADKLVKQWPETLQAWQDEREKILDMSETTLLKSIKAGDTSSAKWILATQGRDRGFSPTIPAAIDDDGQAAFVVSFVSSGKAPPAKKTDKTDKTDKADKADKADTPAKRRGRPPKK